MDPQNSDEHVMQELMRGDESALNELIRRWSGPIDRFIKRMCGSPHAADDVHQEVWIRVFKYRRHYKPIMPFRGYLFKIALNCCRTALRREAPARCFTRTIHQNLDERISGNDVPPIDALIDKERKALLHQAISSLPPKQRAVVLLYILFDTDYGRIADVLERSPGTVRSNMHHALRRLRSTLSRLTRDPESQVDHETLTNSQAR